MLRALLLVSSACLLAAPFLPLAPAQPALGTLAQDEEEAPTEPVFEPVLNAKDHKKLAGLLEDYYEAKREGDDLEAREELNDGIARIEKKNKGFELLSSPADLEAMFKLAQPRPSSVTKGRAKAFEIDEDRSAWGNPIPYAVHAPKGYKASKGAFPMVLVIPPAGEEKLDRYLKDTWTDSAVLEAAVIGVVGMPEDQAAWTEVGEPGQAGGVANAMQVIREITKEFLIDTDRVFIVGHEDGAAAAIHLASMYPDRFAGAASMGGDIQGTPAINFRNMPTLLAGGGAGCTTFEEDAANRGYDNCTREGAYTIESLWAWAGEIQRSPMPSELFFSPPNDFAKAAYWASVEGFDAAESPKLTGSVDRESNTITLTGEGITSVTLSFNDRLVDLSRPVTVVLNGESQEHELARSMSTALETVFASGDPGRVIITRMRYDFPLADTSGDTAEE